jgi:hypothetical protein
MKHVFQASRLITPIGTHVYLSLLMNKINNITKKEES